MPAPPRVFTGDPAMDATNGINGNAQVFRIIGLEDIGGDIGAAWGAGTSEGPFQGNGVVRPINRICKFNNALYAFIGRVVRKYDPGGDVWNVVAGPYTDMQTDYTGGGSPVPTYSWHGGLYVLPKSTAPSGAVLVGFYEINGGFGGGTMAYIVSEDGTTWTKITTNIGIQRTYFQSTFVWENKLFTSHTNVLIVFDPETGSNYTIQGPSTNTTVAVSADYCIFKGKLLAVAPRLGTSNGPWGLFEFAGTGWVEKINFGGSNASQSGTAALFEVHGAELIAFLPLNNVAPGTVIYRITEAGGVYTPSDITAVQMPPGGGPLGADFWPAHTNAHWHVHLDNWTNQKVWYLFFSIGTQGACYIVRFNGYTESLDAMKVDAGLPVAILHKNRNTWSNPKRGEGSYTWEEEGVGDKFDVLVTKVEKRPNQRLRIYFKAFSSGDVIPRRARVIFSSDEAAPGAVAAPLVATNSLNGAFIPATNDALDNVVGDGTTVYWVEWDVSGLVTARPGRLSLAVCWGVF